MDTKPTIEQTLAGYILGGESHPLMTDGYKFSMAQAGFPLRPETFYFTCRRGPALFNPFDLKAVIREFLPKSLPEGKARGFLEAHGYGMTPAMEKALLSDIDIWAIPKDSWALPGEPILTVTGPSFLVSWLEPLCIALNFPLQVATAGRNSEFPTNITATCASEKGVMLTALRAVGLNAEEYRKDITVDPKRYSKGVRQRVGDIKDALDGDIDRAFEVGMRAMTCMEQHELALKACKSLGLTKTSNVYLAYLLGLTPIGTTGHEHQERHGDDANGFRAIRDMRQEPPSYLFDTTHPTLVGIPTAIAVMREDPTRACSMRFDSGDQDEQLRLLLKMCGIEVEFHVYAPSDKAVIRRESLTPNTIFEDGYTAAKTRRNEVYCDDLGWPAKYRFYGYGGFIVYDKTFHGFGRDNVSACFKLTMTAGRACKKHSGTPGKGSLPGRPVIFREIYPTDKGLFPLSLVGQQGEKPPEGYALITDAKRLKVQHMPTGTEKTMSPATKALDDALNAERNAAIEAAQAKLRTHDGLEG